jgi:microcin C transport system substrate-binding protein
MKSLPLLLLALGLYLGPPSSGTLRAEEPENPAADAQTIHKAHAIAMHGEPRYGPDFEHFDYVNPDAPKAGLLRLSAGGTFDSFNPYISKGTPAAGATAETLLARGDDEPFTLYGLIAESIEWPEDRSWVIFNLRPAARWHDGTPITADDVVFSAETMKSRASPVYKFYFKDIAAVEKLGPRRVKFSFPEGATNRELPLIVGGDLPILPKHYWEAPENDFEKTTLTPPLASGPYRIDRFEPGRFVELLRVEDYWGEELPVNAGKNNFERIRYDYFRDPTIIRQALVSGDIDLFVENSAKEWALAYNVPALEQGLLVKERFEDNSSGGMQAFYLNTRRAIFKDPRVRRALAFAYDFDWTNENIYYGAYLPADSYFFGTELAAQGLPEGEELEILEGYRGRVPEEVFTTDYWAPRTDGSGWPRENLLRALDLLEDAGWVVRDMRLVNAETGAPFRFEILIQQKSLERVILPYMRNLRRLGMDVRLRLVDTSQYINRIRAFDFDMIIYGLSQSLSPGNEQRSYWACEAASAEGTRNVAGVCDPVVDELIDLLIAAPDREGLVARTRALDRVLLWGHYSVPNLAAPFDRYVYWNKFSRPEKIPLLGTSVNYWWLDPEKLAALEQRRVRVKTSEGSVEASSGPGLGMVLAILAGLAFAGYIAMRMMNRSHQSRG